LVKACLELKIQQVSEYPGTGTI